MKWNWGTGIALVYVIFAGSMILLVIKSTQQDINLVSDHYYADDVAYQQQYQKIENSMNLGDQVLVSSNASSIEVRFPQGMGVTQGEIFLFCPSDSKQDRHVPIALGAENTMSIPTDGLKRGKWRVKIDWKAGDKDYYQEAMLVL